MRHIIFKEADSYPVAVLIKGNSFNKQELLNNYVTPLVQQGLTEESCIAFNLKYDENGKASVKYIKDYLTALLPALVSLGTTYLLVADSNYFKVLTGQTKADPHYGYVLPCKVKGFEQLQVVLSLNHQALIFNPDLQSKLDMSLHALVSSMQGNYQAIGSNIIHSAHYPESLQDIANVLASLHKYTSLTVDIEAFSLRFNEAGIGSIAFAWDKHNGLAFACDYFDLTKTDQEGLGTQYPNPDVKALLRQFFESYKGELIFHNATYDVKVIIYTLFMKDLLDTEGLLHGLGVMTRNFQDTKIMAYLATNSTAGNSLGLKALAQEFAGNWAQNDIKDIRKIPLQQLLQYNLVDCLSTWYVADKYMPILIQDNQLELYTDLMLPSLKTIIQMEIVGMPMNPKTINLVKADLELQQEIHLTLIKHSPLIKTLNLLVQTSAMDAANAKLKTKQHGLDKFSEVVFNPNSGPQLQRLLYEQMGLPVLDYTDTQQPSTGADTIAKLINHTDEASYKELLSALIGYGKVSKILTTFVPAFERGIDKADGMKYLHGSFNLGGTVSGRLSSSDPNMQNLPAGSKYGKAIKSCFTAPPGWILCGADFSSLEDRINALLTKDPAKLRVYQGHIVYELAINNTIHHIRDDSTINYDGKSYTGREFYETYRTF